MGVRGDLHIHTNWIWRMLSLNCRPLIQGLVDSFFLIKSVVCLFIYNVATTQNAGSKQNPHRSPTAQEAIAGTGGHFVSRHSQSVRHSKRHHIEWVAASNQTHCHGGIGGPGFQVDGHSSKCGAPLGRTDFYHQRPPHPRHFFFGCTSSVGTYSGPMQE